jgi:hypothetical protein
MCGGIQYELTEQPSLAGWCHCTRCQRRTGTCASAQVRIIPGSLRILEGEALLRAWKPEEGFAKVFCSACGSQMWSQSPHDPEVIAVRLGSFDSDPGVRPSYRQFVDYAAPWDPIPDDGLPRFPERRTT